MEMSPTGPDRYREWAGAYVLGALVPSERREFEGHLGGCADCAASVAEFAGLPALLAMLTRDQALALGQSAKSETPPELLTGLAQKIRRRRRRTRLAIAGLVLGAGAASAVVTAAVTAPPPPAAQTAVPAATRLNFAPVVPSPLTATGSITEQAWGTRIEWQCSYAPSPDAYPSRSGTGDARVTEYSLVIVDAHGTATQVATWTAGPGTVVAPTATTSIRVADIRRVEIRSVGNGQALLSAQL